MSNEMYCCLGPLHEELVAVTMGVVSFSSGYTAQSNSTKQLHSLRLYGKAGQNYEI